MRTRRCLYEQCNRLLPDSFIQYIYQAMLFSNNHYSATNHDNYINYYNHIAYSYHYNITVTDNYDTTANHHNINNTAARLSFILRYMERMLSGIWLWT